MTLILIKKDPKGSSAKTGDIYPKPRLRVSIRKPSIYSILRYSEMLGETAPTNRTHLDGGSEYVGSGTSPKLQDLHPSRPGAHIIGTMLDSSVAGSQCKTDVFPELVPERFKGRHGNRILKSSGL